MTALTHVHDCFALPGAGFLTGFGRLWRALAAAHAAGRDYERLAGRTDAALAREGLTREGVARAIFEKHFA